MHQLQKKKKKCKQNLNIVFNVEFVADIVVANTLARECIYTVAIQI